MKKILKWGLIGFVALIVLVMMTGSSDNDERSSKEGSSTPVKNEQGKEIPTAEVLEIDAQQFIDDFDKNQLAAEEKYAEKIIKFSAYINNISEDILGSPFLSLKPTAQEYYFDTSIQCFFEDKSELTPLQNGQKVTVQGKFDAQSLGIIIVKKCKIVK